MKGAPKTIEQSTYAATPFAGDGARFGDIKRDEYFWFAGKEWKRTRGRFAVPVALIGTGTVGVSFSLETVVYPSEPKEIQPGRRIRLLAELDSQGEILAAGMEMPVRVINRVGAAAVGANGKLHFIKRADFETIE